MFTPNGTNDELEIQDLQAQIKYFKQMNYTKEGIEEIIDCIFHGLDDTAKRYGHTRSSFQSAVDAVYSN